MYSRSDYLVWVRQGDGDKLGCTRSEDVFSVGLQTRQLQQTSRVECTSRVESCVGSCDAYQLFILDPPFPPFALKQRPLDVCPMPLDSFVRCELDRSVGYADEGQEGAFVQSADAFLAVYRAKSAWKRVSIIGSRQTQR